MAAALIAPERLSELIGLIYDCAIDHSAWPVAMDAIRIELACHNATLDLVALPSGEVLNSATVNVPPAYLPLMTGAGPDVIEQWGGEEALRSVPLGQPAVLSRVNPTFEVQMEHNHYYQAFAKPQGLIDVMAIGLARDARALGALAFGRHHSQGPIGEREIEIARLLLPHLQRAATINRMIEKEANARATLISTLDALTVPVALLNCMHLVVHANPAARTILEEGHLVRCVAGRLEPTTRTGSRAFASAIAAIARGDDGVGSRGFSLPIEDGAGRAAALHILPLLNPAHARSATAYRSTTGRTDAIVAIFISSGLTPSATAIDIAAKLFNLTEREADVLEQLAQGHSQAETASRLEIGLSTVKTHLGKLYSKLGVNSQAELIGIASTLSIPVAV